MSLLFSTMLSDFRTLDDLDLNVKWSLLAAQKVERPIGKEMMLWLNLGDILYNVHGKAR
jgi:hypothetical protein